MAEKWYKLSVLPDLTLNKYASLDGNGVDGVLGRHIAFLRQLNRKGIVSGLSFHLFYLYLKPDDPAKDLPGHRLHIFLLIRGSDSNTFRNIPALISASPLADFYSLEEMNTSRDGRDLSAIEALYCEKELEIPSFNTCAILTKSEVLLPAANGEAEDYYMLRDWEMNEDGRLYDMCRMMEKLDRNALYRIDIYPVERSISLRDALRKPMSILRKRQDERGSGSRKDYDGKDVLDSYEEMLERYDSEPHFIANIMAFAEEREDALSILDAAGSESLKKGKYNITSFTSDFTPMSFLDDEPGGLENIRDGMIARKGKVGLVVCKTSTADINLNYLPTLFTLDEIAPFFRLPALYDGEVIQMAKETAPSAVSQKGSIHLGKDENGYDVFFPLSLLPKHAFVSGVPGSGKTNAMCHLASSLWKREPGERIPFLVLEPAKQEYRALANDPDMREMYLFSPNADMSFPLHINPFEMPRGILVAEHIRRLCSVFEGAFPLEPPMPFLLDTAIEAVYRSLGWIPDHVYTGDEMDGSQKRPLPTMSMLYKRLEEELRSTEYSDEVRGNLESALKVRIGSLLRREMGDVFDVPTSTFPPEKWLEVPAVIELESMGPGPANFLTLMLCSLIRETLKANPRFSGKLRHVIFIEEAHNLIGPEAEEQSGSDADPKRAATAFIVKMLAEVRALKEGIVIADQLPTVMAQEVLKNTGLKIGLRITSADDRSLLGSTMAANGVQLERMATFEPGEALIFYENLMRPFNMRINRWWGHLDDEVKIQEMTTPKNDDAELRAAIANTDSYRDANAKSIRIIEDKYRRKLIELDELICSAENWANSIFKLSKEVELRKDALMKKQMNKAEIDTDEFALECEKLELLEQTRLQKQSDVRPYNDVKAIIQTLAAWVEMLERLKNGRWARFDAPKGELAQIQKLQVDMCSKATRLYQIVAYATGNTKHMLSVKAALSPLNIWVQNQEG